MARATVMFVGEPIIGNNRPRDEAAIMAVTGALVYIKHSPTQTIAPHLWPLPDASESQLGGMCQSNRSKRICVARKCTNGGGTTNHGLNHWRRP